jgi:ubiquinone/menaquinone biosynthesis C-methylase UbiE
MNRKFSAKWKNIKKHKKNSDENRLFVCSGDVPETQRQLNLFYYFLYIKNIYKNSNVKKVLEVGCGRGTMSLYLANYLKLDLSLLDSAEEAIMIAKKEFKKYNEKASFYVSSALDSGIENEKFDSIVSIGLAEHIDDVEKLFKEQYRLLGDSGIMISLNLPKKFSVQFLNDVMKFLKYLFTKKRKPMGTDYYRNSLNPGDYKRIAEKVGFKNVSVTNVCPFPIYVPVGIKTDKKITKVRKVILSIRGLFQKYPYKTNYIMSQGHFLVGYK